MFPVWNVYVLYFSLDQISGATDQRCNSKEVGSSKALKVKYVVADIFHSVSEWNQECILTLCGYASVFTSPMTICRLLHSLVCWFFTYHPAPCWWRWGFMSPCLLQWWVPVLYELCNTRAFEYNAWQWQRCRNSKLFIPRCRDSIRNPPMPSLLLDHKEFSQTKYVSFCRCTWWKWLKIQGGGSW